MRAHTAKAWSCLPQNKFPPPSAPVLQLYQEQGWGWERKWSLHRSVLRQDNLSHPQPCLCWTSSGCSHSHPSVVQPSWALSLPSLGMGHCGLDPALQGVRAGLFAHCTSLCIPSLFPMQIKLMRIRNIMEPIHRSSRWKMGLTTNFPLQLFCNYRGIL